MSVFASDRAVFEGEPAHQHYCRVNRNLPPAYEPHSFTCFGTTDQACEQARVVIEMSCLLEEEVRRLGGNPSVVLDRWESEVNSGIDLTNGY
jgi:hypothetical protein